MSSIPSTTAATGMRLQEAAEKARKRFEIECEFLLDLAQKGYFKADYFVNYLKYLLYFKWPYMRELSNTLNVYICLNVYNKLNFVKL
uniref:Uncharacterized protein n=1 Tax=Meloidogyne enterolobii TaxID=390850 RepID=A0A6V7XK61_MELEN|nr:unnamed protein product [Meloidogyne enterolobii]